MEIIVLIIVLLWGAAAVSVFLIFSDKKRDKKYYNDKVPFTEKWAKILYFHGGSRMGSGSSVGESYIKLSDGRIFSMWGNPFSFNASYNFKQLQGGELKGTYNRSSHKLSVDKGITYQCEIIEDKKIFSLSHDGSEYSVQINNDFLGDQIKKDGEIFADINKVTQKYMEILFKPSLVSDEELFIVSLIVMGERLI